MIGLDVHVDGDNAWPELKDRELLHCTLTGVAALRKGMASGRASVMVRIDLPDGRVVMAETTMRLFLNAAHLFKIKFGDELTGPA